MKKWLKRIRGAVGNQSACVRSQLITRIDSILIRPIQPSHRATISRSFTTWASCRGTKVADSTPLHLYAIHA